MTEYIIGTELRTEDGILPAGTRITVTDKKDLMFERAECLVILTNERAYRVLEDEFIPALKDPHTVAVADPPHQPRDL